MTSWDEIKIVIAAVGTIFVPGVIGFSTHFFANAMKERELQGRFVEIAVDILRENPSKETTNIRDWATRVISKYSGVKLQKAEDDLIESISFPSAKIEGTTLIALINLKDALNNIIAILEIRKTNYADPKETRWITLKVAELKAIYARLEAYEQSLFAGHIKPSHLTEEELHHINRFKENVESLTAKDISAESAKEILEQLTLLISEFFD